MLVFAHPWIYFLAPLPLLVRFLLPAETKTQPAVRVPFLSRLQSATDGNRLEKSAKWLAPALLKTAVWILLVTALARPQWLEPPIERTIPTRDLLVLIDLSSSMSHEDFVDSSGEAIDRLDAVKDVLGEFLMQCQGDRVGLVVFGNAPFLQVPFTTDLELCRQLLDETRVGMAGPRTALGDAIGLGIKLFEQSDAPTKTIIALTDGNDTASSVPAIEAARVAHDRKITVYTIAIGDPATVGEEKLDTAALQEIAALTGGKYYLALDRRQLADVYWQLDKIETIDAKTVSYQPRSDVYYYPLAVALAMWMLPAAWRVGVDRRKPQPTASDYSGLRLNGRTLELEAAGP